MSDEITAAAKAAIDEVKDHGMKVAEAAHRAGEKAVGNVERAAHDQIARAKAGNPASIVTIFIVVIAVAGLVYGLVHSHS